MLFVRLTIQNIWIELRMDDDLHIVDSNRQ